VSPDTASSCFCDLCLPDLVFSPLLVFVCLFVYDCCWKREERERERDRERDTDTHTHTHTEREREREREREKFLKLKFEKVQTWIFVQHPNLALSIMSAYDEFEAEVQAVEDEKMVWRQEVTWDGQLIQQYFAFEPQISLETIRVHLRSSCHIPIRTEGQTATSARLYCSHRFLKLNQKVMEKRKEKKKQNPKKKKREKPKEKPKSKTLRAKSRDLTCSWLLNLKKVGTNGWTVTQHHNMHCNHLNTHELIQDSTRSGLSEEFKIVRTMKDLPPELITKIEENYKSLVPTFLMKDLMHEDGCDVTTRCLANIRHRQNIDTPSEGKAIVSEVS